LLRAGVKAQCRQVMGSVHGGDLMVSLQADISRTTARDMAGWMQECGVA
jgi:acetyl esterase